MDQQNKISSILAHHGYIKSIGHCRCGMKLAAHGSQYLRHHQAEMIIKGLGSPAPTETNKISPVVTALLKEARDMTAGSTNRTVNETVVDLVARTLGYEDEEHNSYEVLSMLILGEGALT